VPPLGSFGPFTAREMVAPVLFVLVAAMLSGFSDSLRAARSRAEARELEALELAQQLEEQALELEVQVEETQTMNVALEEQADTARRAREQAETANTAKMQFLTMMSHELRTPLNAIAGYTELLALGVHGPVNGQQREDLKRIQHNQKHLLGVINDILNFAKVETGHVQFDVTDVSSACASATRGRNTGRQARSDLRSLRPGQRLPHAHRGRDGVGARHQP
jgi:signal transduction histidine kinase